MGSVYTLDEVKQVIRMAGIAGIQDADKRLFSNLFLPHPRLSFRGFAPAPPEADE
ncbi:hypothetical protein M1O52_04655 [Dehalococcoidia bacterium]|nr:hypothetical protein [Dehalococcoidia bacterium]